MNLYLLNTIIQVTGRNQRSQKIPATPTFSSEWALGKPDIILSQEKPFLLEADGRDVYRNFVVPTNFDSPRYVEAVAVRPGNAKIVHHVIAFVDEHKRTDRLLSRVTDGKEGYETFGGPGFAPDTSFGGWAPGIRPRKTPAGTGFLLKPGARIVMQIHYHKTGKEESDQTKIGLYFSKQPVKKVMEIAWMANPLLRIPADAEDHKATLKWPVPVPITLYSVMPHMHLLGKSMRAVAILPDGKTVQLVQITAWDFNWQLNYAFKEPIKLPAGSRIEIEAHYDNSTNNRNNPSRPPRRVTWGEETTDEMFLLVGAYTRD